MLFYYIYLLPLCFSVLSSLNILRLDWPKHFKLFSIFLTTTFSVEIVALLWSLYWHQTPWWHFPANNIWIYNLYLVPQYLFYFYFFSSMLTSQTIKKLSGFIGGAFVIIALINLFLRHQLFRVDAVTIVIANFIMVFYTIAYFMQLLKASSVERLSRQPLFWIAAGAFIFHIGNLPCFMLFNYISAINAPLATSLFRIITTLNCVMYTLYSIAFLCTRRFQTIPS